jgi:hypothetical protein
MTTILVTLMALEYHAPAMNAERTQLVVKTETGGQIMVEGTLTPGAQPGYVDLQITGVHYRGTIVPWARFEEHYGVLAREVRRQVFDELNVLRN